MAFLPLGKCPCLRVLLAIPSLGHVLVAPHSFFLFSDFLTLPGEAMGQRKRLIGGFGRRGESFPLLTSCLPIRSLV